MEHLLESLLEMGFERTRAEKALKATSCAGLAEAMDWLIAHEDDIDKLDPDTLKPKEAQEAAVQIVHEKLNEKVSATIPATEPKTNPNSEPSDGIPPDSLIAHSYKCDDCNKLLKNEQELEFHAAKSKHTRFSESTEVVKALTEEEKKTRILQLHERLRLKREEKEAEIRKGAKDAEKHRRRTGQEILAAKQRVEEQEMKKIAEDRKRQKKEDILTKKKILEEIQRDKEARQREKQSLLEGEQKLDSREKAEKAVVSQNVVATGNYENCRIQIRMLDGRCLTHTFKAKEQLSAVRLYAEMNRTDDKTVPFNLITNLPHRLFDDEDMEATLEHLGLVPSAVLTMTRRAVC